MDEEKDPHVTAAPVTSENVELDQNENGWQMPEPVFRQSSGYLPKGFENRFHADGGGTATAAATEAIPNAPGEPNDSEPAVPVASAPPVAAAAPSVPSVTAVPATNIEPQPDILEDLLVEEAPLEPAKPERSPRMKIFLALLGIASMIIFAVIFIAVIYYLFFYYPGDSTQF